MTSALSLSTKVPHPTTGGGRQLQDHVQNITNRLNNTITFQADNKGQTQSIPNQQNTILTFSNPVTDTVNGFSNSQYTINQSGNYMFTASVKLTANIDNLFVFGAYPNPPFVSTILSANQSVSDSTINVENSQLFKVGMLVVIITNGAATNSYSNSAVVTSVPNVSSITINPALTQSATSGASVYGVLVPTGTASGALVSFSIDILQNGNSIVHNEINSATLVNPILNCNKIIPCNPNDIIKVQVYQNSGSSLNTNGAIINTFFQGIRFF